MPTGSTAAAAARKRLYAANYGPAETANKAAVADLQAAGYPTTVSTVNNGLGTVANYRVGTIGALANNIRAQAGAQPPPQQQRQSAPSSGGRSGGGGGGGAGVTPFSQAYLDWAAQLMQGARPGALAANNLDLPDYQGMAMRAFDPTMFNQARTAWGQGVTQDLGTADRSTQDMLAFLNRNYTNAYNNPLQGFATINQAPGMDQQAMQRLLQSQGVNPNINAATQNEGLQADQALRNVWAMLGVNEDRAQQNRLANAQQYGTQAREGITAAGRAGTLGIDLGQGQAQAAWQKAADERAYQDYQLQQQLLQQEALQSWQRANQVQDVNAQNTNSYNNAVLQAMLGLIPQLQTNPNLQLPANWQLGMGPLPGGGTDPSDPYNWKGIAAAQAAGGA